MIRQKFHSIWHSWRSSDILRKTWHNIDSNKFISSNQAFFYIFNRKKSLEECVGLWKNFYRTSVDLKNSLEFLKNNLFQ